MISRELLNLMADDDYGFWMRMIEGKDIPYDFLTHLAENITSVICLENVRLGLQNGITIELIKLYAKSCYDYKHMEIIRKGLECCKDDKAKVDLIKTYCYPTLDSLHMSVVLDGIKNNFSESQINQLASQNDSWKQALHMYTDFLRSNRANHLSELISAYNEVSKKII